MKKIRNLIIGCCLVIFILSSPLTEVRSSISMNGITIKLNEEIIQANDKIYVTEMGLIKIFKASYKTESKSDNNSITIDNKDYYSITSISETLGYNVKWIDSENRLNIFKTLNEDEKSIVTHGGGHLEYYDSHITNTKNSLDNAYAKGSKLIELDIIWTTDLVPVISHDWKTLSKYANVPYKEEGYSSKEFSDFNLWYEWEQLTFSNLILWLTQHPDVFIITDVKDHNLTLMHLLNVKYPMYKNRFIPQVFSEEEYYEVKQLGYEPIIFTLYQSADTNEKVIHLAILNPDLIITMDEDRVNTGLAQSLENIGTYTYCHTINDYETRLKYMRKGINGFYSDVFDVDMPTRYEVYNN